MASLEGYTFATADQFIGQSLGTSDWLTIEQERINTFADCTEDHQWIHVDEERANAGPMGATIAHGYLSMSLLTKLTESIGILPAGNITMALNYGADKIRFLTPVKVGSRVRLHSVLQGVTNKGGGRYLFKVNNTMEIEGEPKPAMIAETLFMAFTA